MDSLELLKNFRPISLCNVTNKIITKIIANWIKRSLDKVIGLHQCSFIPSQHRSNNIIVVQEAIHVMKTKKERKKSFMAIKVDVKKAYDKLDWDFLEYTLEDMGFKRYLVDLIMCCISTCTMKVI